MEIKLTIADPCGNTTLFVEGPIAPENYAAMGKLLLQHFPKAEQVAFVCDPLFGAEGRIEMSGGEFCGNASRAFGMLLAQRRGLERGCVPIEISGCAEPVNTTIDLAASTAFADMPLPRHISIVSLPAPFGLCPLVQQEGIWHLLAFGVKADAGSFEMARQAIYCKNDPAALGVMFLNPEGTEMTPMVYVRDTGTVYSEGSCGSGTAAVGAFLAMEKQLTELSIRQPGGTLQVRMEKRGVLLTGLRIGGRVSLGESMLLQTEELCGREE